MMDFVLINSQFCSSVLDTQVLHSTYPVSDHEMVVFSMNFKVKSKCHHNRVPLRQTTDLPSNSQIQFRSESPELSWNDFKAAMSDAYKTLPELSKKQKEDWVTDELLNLPKRKKKCLDSPLWCWEE